MPSAGLRYACAACGRKSLRWEGRCPGCGEWHTLTPVRATRERRAGKGRDADAAPAHPSPLAAVGGAEKGRLSFRLGDLDLVLGGGAVPGSLALLGGAPGVGKSTLLLQAAGRIARQGGVALYASGEESGEQVRLRAGRIGAVADRVLFLAETDVDRLVRAAEKAEPALLCVDSVQTLRTEALSSAPGTVNQVRECASVLQTFAKTADVPVFLVGHVTKGGALAGPRTLEHLVDVVLHLDGPRSAEHRILRATKNRFGSAGELAVFLMTAAGLEAVPDPATAFLSGRPCGVSGSAVAVTLEGSRPLLAEVQALVAPGRFGTPQRTATGFSGRRLGMLLAVLERRAGLSAGEGDVFVNVVGGLRLTDPAADLAVVAALASAALDRPLPEGHAFIGEVGLGGEVRGAARMDRRLREVQRAGLAVVVGPRAGKGTVPAGLELRPVADVREALAGIQGRRPAASAASAS